MQFWADKVLCVCVGGGGQSLFNIFIDSKISYVYSEQLSQVKKDIEGKREINSELDRERKTERGVRDNTR